MYETRRGQSFRGGTSAPAPPPDDAVLGAGEATTVGEGRIGHPSPVTGGRPDPVDGPYCYRARQYDPVQGRFISRDPLGGAPGTNLYEYVADRPTFGVDPSGNDYSNCTLRFANCYKEIRLICKYRCECPKKLKDGPIEEVIRISVKCDSKKDNSKEYLDLCNSKKKDFALMLCRGDCSGCGGTKPNSGPDCPKGK